MMGMHSGLIQAASISFQTLQLLFEQSLVKSYNFRLRQEVNGLVYALHPFYWIKRDQHKTWPMAMRSSINFHIDLPLFPIQVSQLNNQTVKLVEFEKIQSNSIRTISIVNKIQLK